MSYPIRRWCRYRHPCTCLGVSASGFVVGCVGLFPVFLFSEFGLHVPVSVVGNRGCFVGRKLPCVCF